MPLSMTLIGDVLRGAAQLKGQSRRQIALSAGEFALPLVGAALCGAAAVATTTGAGAIGTWVTAIVPCAGAALAGVPTRLANVIAAAASAPRKLKNCIDPVTLGGERLRRPPLGERRGRSIPYACRLPPV
jgi:hypothetical protein